jgi:hypothetical protein
VASYFCVRIFSIVFHGLYSAHHFCLWPYSCVEIENVIIKPVAYVIRYIHRLQVQTDTFYVTLSSGNYIIGSFHFLHGILMDAA